MQRRGDWKETAILRYEEALAEKALDAYGPLRLRLDRWGAYMRERVGPGGYKSPDWRDPILRGAKAPEPEIPIDFHLLSLAVAMLPSGRDGLNGPQELEAVEARYLWRRYIPRPGTDGKLRRLYGVQDRDVGSAIGVGRTKGQTLLLRALAHLSGQLTGLMASR